MTWQVTVELTALEDLDDQAAGRLTSALPTRSLAQRTERGVRAVVPGVDEPTAGQALDHALQALLSALEAAGLPAGEFAAGEVLTSKVASVQADNPPVPPILGLVDVAQLLGVSRQRVNQLASGHPGFPPPAARTSATPIWTRASIETFQRDYRGRPAAAVK